jgi:hypothetical protein
VRLREWQEIQILLLRKNCGCCGITWFLNNYLQENDHFTAKSRTLAFGLEKFHKKGEGEQVKKNGRPSKFKPEYSEQARMLKVALGC